MLRNIQLVTLTLILGLAVPLPLQAQDAARADDLYRTGDYQGAIAQYEAVLSSGLASADLYYNLGNAYYRTDQMGPAVLNYCRALRLRPGMSDARENLALAESRTTDRITVMPRLFLVRWIDALTQSLSPSGWRWVVVILLALLGAAVVTLRLGRTRGLRKAGLVVTLVAAMLWLVALLFTIRATVRYNDHAEAVVMRPAVTVKSSPEQQSADKMVLHEGTRLTVSDSLAGWYKITIADGTSGWCSEADIERI